MESSPFWDAGGLGAEPPAASAAKLESDSGGVLDFIAPKTHWSVSSSSIPKHFPIIFHKDLSINLYVPV